MKSMPLPSRRSASAMAKWKLELPPSMMTSPFSRTSSRVLMVSSVGSPDGSISHTARGGSSAFTRASREPAPSAPSDASLLTEWSLRSHATTSWPCCVRRSVMLAPMRPSPTIPIFIRTPFPFSTDLLQVVDLDAQDPPAVGLQALEVADGLGVDECSEVIRLPRDLHVSARRARCDLHGDDFVGAALVELAGRVQEPRAVARRD